MARGDGAVVRMPCMRDLSERSSVRGLSGLWIGVLLMGRFNDYPYCDVAINDQAPQTIKKRM